MAVVWPSKNNFANGDVLTAANMNNIADTLNVYNPTSATNGQVPIANGSGSVAFGTLSVNAYQVISSGTLSTATGTLTLSSIPGTYKDLILYVRNFYPATSGANARIQFNNNSGTVYWANGLYASGSIDGGSKTGQVNVQSSAASNTQEGHIVVWVYDYAQATPTNAMSCATYRTSVGGNQQDFRFFGMISDTAITRMDFTVNTGNFGAGDYVLYGVN